MSWEAQLGTMDDNLSTEFYPKLRFVDTNNAVNYSIVAINDTSRGQAISFGDIDGALYGLNVDLYFYSAGSPSFILYYDGNTGRMLHSPSDGQIPAYHYTNISDIADTEGDFRHFASGTTWITQYCATGNTAKGTGTWVNATNEVKRGNYVYHAITPAADTTGDWRQYASGATFLTQYCTAGSSTKGGGTWVTKQTIS
jgi:hypothetical protein